MTDIGLLTPHPEALRLGRKKAADPRDRMYRAIIHPGIGDSLAFDPLNPWAGLPQRYRYYRKGPQLDQRATSRCTAFALAQLVQTGSIMQNIPHLIRQEAIDVTLIGMDRGVTYVSWTDEALLDEFLTRVYVWSQRQDEWPGEEPAYYGTSERAAAEAYRLLGFWPNYWWLTSVEEVARYLILHGPVPVATDWFEGMWNTKTGGEIRISGAWVGGHAWLLDGVNVNEQIFRWRQSWGSTMSWGWIHFSDLRYLLQQGGTALALPEIRVPRPKVPG